MQRIVAAIVLLLTLPGLALASDVTADFEGGSNTGSWAFIRGGDIIEATGGNPDGWLHQPTYDTFAPILDCAWFAPDFTGDYQAMMVNGISIDLQTLALNFGDGNGFSLSLVLRSSNGTPNDITDDDYVYFVGDNIPLVGAGWETRTFDVPSTSPSMPAGWKGGWIGDCETLRPGVTWGDVMTNVDRVEFWWLDPCFSAIFQQWNVGADNISITCDGAVPIEAATWGQIKASF